MSVEMSPNPDGRTHIVLGVVEKWIVTAIGAAVIGVGWWLVTSMQALLTYQAVTNERLESIDNRLTGVPQLQQQVTKLEVRVDRLETDVEELRSTRKLK
jgi:hypothetical protein